MALLTVLISRHRYLALLSVKDMEPKQKKKKVGRSFGSWTVSRKCYFLLTENAGYRFRKYSKVHTAPSKKVINPKPN